jgi:nucleoside-diphosphate-sugar epimerase
VDDVTDAIGTIGLDPRAEGEDFNIGTGVETSVRELLQLLWEGCGKKGTPEVVTTDPLPVDVRRRVPGVSKIRSLLGWSSSIPLDEGIRRTVDWYLAESGMAVSANPRI